LNFKCIKILNLKHSENKAIWNISFDQYFNFLAVGDEDTITIYNFKELRKIAIIHPDSKERYPPENCIIHRLSAGKKNNNKIYGIKFTKANIVVAVVKADDEFRD